MTQIEIARKLAKDAGLDPKAADAIVQAVAEYTDTIAPVGRDYLDKRLAETDTRIVQVESTLIKWVVGTAIAAVNFLTAHYKS
jgi:hypothetical protein